MYVYISIFIIMKLRSFQHMEKFINFFIVYLAIFTSWKDYQNFNKLILFSVKIYQNSQHTIFTIKTLCFYVIYT